MKNICIIVLIALSFTSCHKDEVSINFQGKWSWVQSTGGLDGGTLTPETIGASRSIEISDATIRFFEDGMMVAEFDYQIESRTSILDSKKYDMIILADNRRMIIHLENNKLYLTEDCYDCYQSEYIKIN